MLGYRTVLTADETNDNIDNVLRLLKRWVVEKKRFPSMPSEGAVESPSGAVLTASSFETASAKGLRWQLVEDWDPPRWTSVEHSSKTAVTHITLVVAQDRLWFWVDIETPTLSLRDHTGRLVEEAQYSGTPAFMPEILEAVEMKDGLAEPRSGFQEIPNASDVDWLVDVVQDETRLGAVFVTSPPVGLSMEEWVAQSNRRSYAMQGLAVGYVLSPDALAEFNRRARFGHSVPTGGMRTFLPGADLGDPADAVNHRLMLPSTIRDSDDRRLHRILRGAQIRRLRGIRLPQALREADYEFLRKRRMQPFGVLHQARPEPKTSEQAGYAAEIARLRQGLADAEELAEEALHDISRFQKERDDALEQSELDQMEAEETYIKYSRSTRENEKLKALVAHLRAKLVEAGSAAAAWTQPDEASEEGCPGTFAELVDRLGDLQWQGQLPGVRFTGDRDEVCELDEHSGLGEAAVAKAWDALVTFDSYVRMRDSGSFSHSFSAYVNNGEHGGVVRIGKIVWAEGQQTKKGKLGEQRKFPVDKKVSPSGKKLMVAHVKLSNLTGVAPRMYFEDTYSSVGYVTVGYLGSHLENTLTN